MSAALKGLELLGVSFPESDEDIRTAIAAEIRQIDVNLRGRSIASLADEPFTDNPEARILIGLFAEASPHFYVTRPILSQLINSRGVNLCLNLGHVQESTFIYSAYAMMLAGVYNDIPSAFQFSEMSIKLSDRLPRGCALKGCSLFFHASIVNIWCRHIRDSLPMLDQAFQAFLDSGDFNWAGFLTYHAIWQHLENGESLEQVIAIARRYTAFNQQYHYKIVYNLDRIEEQFLLSLQGKTRSMTDLNDDGFDEALSIAEIEQAHFGIGITYYSIIKLIAAFIAGRFSDALVWADRTAPNLAHVSGMAIKASYCFFYALTLAALHNQASAQQQRILMEKLLEC